MTSRPKTVVANIVENALRELCDTEYQYRVWLGGSSTDNSSMTEATAALFNDSGLDEALEKNAVTFSLEIDNDLRKLRLSLRSCLRAEAEKGTAATISSGDWETVRLIAAGILAVLGRKH